MASPTFHQPVLLQEVVDGLSVTAGGVYVDGTFGRGGHSQAIRARLGPSGKLVAIDRDPEAMEYARCQFSGDPRVTLAQEPFSRIRSICEQLGVVGGVNGILLDLGVSSPQLDDPQRGFSFNRNGPLDMRMGSGTGPNAAEWLKAASETDIASVLREYGEERFSRRIARAIVAARRAQPIETTGQLATLVADAVPTRERGKHPATRTFLALRIRVNAELDELHDTLTQFPDLLAPGGRLAVIAFHSLEDRIAKRFIRVQVRGEAHTANMPLREDQRNVRFRAIGKAIRPSATEIDRNPRARSAVLRIAEKLP